LVDQDGLGQDFYAWVAASEELLKGPVVVAARPSRRPASPRRKAPVHTLATSAPARYIRRSQGTTSAFAARCSKTSGSIAGMTTRSLRRTLSVFGDCLQNWGATDEYFNWLGGAMTRMMGFIRPHNIGPGWLRQCKPPKEELRAILGQTFANVVPAHGAAVIGNAVELYRPVIERVAQVA
jgi:hypothetical protein